MTRRTIVPAKNYSVHTWVIQFFQNRKHAEICLINTASEKYRRSPGCFSYIRRELRGMRRIWSKRESLGTIWTHSKPSKVFSETLARLLKYSYETRENVGRRWSLDIITVCYRCHIILACRSRLTVSNRDDKPPKCPRHTRVSPYEYRDSNKLFGSCTQLVIKGRVKFGLAEAFPL